MRRILLAAALGLASPAGAEEAVAPAASAAQAKSALPEDAASLTGDLGDRGRPYRLGFMSLNSGLDQVKPLALFDPAGFVVNSGILVGGFDQRWIGGLSMQTTKVLWWFDGTTDLTAPPGSFGSNVVLGFRDGKVVKLDALTGKKIWTASLDSFVERPLLLSGTTLYVLTAAQVLYALDFQTGKTQWLYDGGFPEGLTIRGGARPIIHDGKVLFGIASGEILAVNADTGKLVWRYNPAYNDARFHGVVGEMLIRGNKLIITRYDGLVAAIDIAGSVRSVAWQEQLPGLTTSAFRGNRIYVGALNGDVYALDADGGRKVFHAQTGASVTSITAGETSIFVTGTRGRITAIDAGVGNVLWHDSIGGSIASAPVLYENAILFNTGSKSIYAYKLR